MARISAHSALQRAGHPHMGVGEQKQNTKRALKRPNRGNRGARVICPVRGAVAFVVAVSFAGLSVN